MYMFDTQEKTDEIPLHQMYMFDTQEKTDLRKTKKILLSNGKLIGCCVNGGVWIYSCAVCADQQLDNRDNLVDIMRDKFMEAEGVCERPNGIKYLSAHCYFSLLVLGSHLEALMVPVHRILLTAKAN